MDEIPGTFQTIKQLITVIVIGLALDAVVVMVGMFMWAMVK